MFLQYSRNGIVIASIDDVLTGFHSLIGSISQNELPTPPSTGEYSMTEGAFVGLVVVDVGFVTLCCFELCSMLSTQEHVLLHLLCSSSLSPLSQ